MNSPVIRSKVDAALAALDENDLIELALGLAGIPSPPGQDEEVARFLDKQMRSRGLRSWLQPIAPGQSNVVGTLDGSGGGRTLMFNGHLHSCRLPAHMAPSADVVIPEAGIVDDEWIYGDGIANMKSALAAYVAAVAAIGKADIDIAGNAMISGVVGTHELSPVDRFQGSDFNGFGMGVQHLITHGGVADFCVVGEPTGLKLVAQHCGTTRARIRIVVDRSSFISQRDGVPTQAERERAVHEWMQQANPVVVAADVVQALREWIPDYQRRHTLEGVVPQVTIKALDGGNPWGGPGTDCNVYVTIRTPPAELPIAIKKELHQALQGVRKQNSHVRIDTDLYVSVPGPKVSEGNPLCEALHAAHKEIHGTPPESSIVQWYSDAAHFNSYNIPAINYGPAWGRIRRDAPMFDEHVHIGDLIACTRVYIALIVRLCHSSES